MGVKIQSMERLIVHPTGATYPFAPTATGNHFYMTAPFDCYVNGKVYVTTLAVAGTAWTMDVIIADGGWDGTGTTQKSNGAIIANTGAHPAQGTAIALKHLTTQGPILRGRQILVRVVEAGTPGTTDPKFGIVLELVKVKRSETI